jgi:hypothetical protein
MHLTPSMPLPLSFFFCFVLVCETKAKARRKTKKGRKGNDFFFKDGKKTQKNSLL